MKYCIPNTKFCVEGWWFIVAVVLEVIIYSTIAFHIGKKLKRKIKK
jgi:hypothetical protein